ncbi:MAG: DUF4432 family protein [Calditrichia bacterium]
MTHPNRNYGCRISDDWQLKGMKTVVMENELLRITILADKGSDIYEFLYKPLDIDFMWRRPGELRNPNRGLPTNATENGPFMDFYEGCWQEILPSGGPANVHNGIPYGQHGEVCNLPWRCEILNDSPEEISCKFSIRAIRTPVRVEKTLTLKRGNPALFIEEKLFNECPEKLDFMWGHHLTFGEPFLDEHCRIDTPASEIYIHPVEYSKNHRFLPAKKYPFPFAKNRDGKDEDFRVIPPKSRKSEDMTYFLDLKEPWFALTHTQKQVGFALRWTGDVFRYLWYWQVFNGGQGYPWFSNTYNIGLEPWTSLPTSGLSDVVKQKTHLVLPPNGQISASMTAAIYTGLSEVNHVSINGKVS